jgi:hypothetical protein
MYNPDYLKRPYIIVLNKIDRPEAAAQWESVRDRLLSGEDSKAAKGPESEKTTGNAASGEPSSSGTNEDGNHDADVISRGLVDDSEEGSAREEESATGDWKGMEEQSTPGSGSHGIENEESRLQAAGSEVFSDWDALVARAKAEAGLAKSKRSGAGRQRQEKREEDGERNSAPKAVLGISARYAICCGWKVGLFLAGYEGLTASENKDCSSSCWMLALGTCN